MPASILVADGSRDCADAVAMLLTSSGMEATVAYDGRTAIELAVRERFSAAVMDLTLPAVSGFAVGSELRRTHGASIRLVAYTAWPPSFAEVPEASFRFDEVVNKASDPMELLCAVSPDLYGTVLRSMKASAVGARLELELADTLLDRASLGPPPRDRDVRGWIASRLNSLERSLERLVAREEREALRDKLRLIRARLRNDNRR